MELDEFIIGLLVGWVIGTAIGVFLYMFLRPKKVKKHLWVRNKDCFINLAQSHLIEWKEREQSIHISFDSSKTTLTFPSEKDYEEGIKTIENIILG